MSADRNASGESSQVRALTNITTIGKLLNLRAFQDEACLTDFHNSVFSQGAKMCRLFMKFRALFGTPKQTLKNTQPISTKCQDLLNLYERHAVDTF